MNKIRILPSAISLLFSVAPAVAGTRIQSLCDEAYDGHLKQVSQIIDQGININDTGPGQTAVMCAVSGGNLDVVKALINAGADVNATLDIAGPGGTPPRETALMIAAQKGNEAIALFLIDKGANINAINGQRDSALNIAANYGNAAVARLLIKAGADTAGVNPNFLQKIKNLKTSKIVNPGYLGEELISAASWDQRGKVKALLDRQADVNFQSSLINNQTALMVATKKGASQIIQLLLNKGADCNLRDGDGATAIMFAAFQGHADLVSLLISKGANVKATNDLGMTALMFSGNPKVAQILIDKGADINAKDKHEKTALSYAAQSHPPRTDFAKLLISNGADTSGIDPEFLRSISAKAP